MTDTDLAPRILDCSSEADDLFVTLVRDADRKVVDHATEEFYAALYVVSDEQGGGYVLWWNDYVVNEWAEFVPDLPTALARLGMLIDAGLREAFYDTTLAEFTADVRSLFDRHAS